MALKGLQNFEEIYVSDRDYMPAILQIIDKIKCEKIFTEDFNKFCKYIEDIPAFERRWYEKLQWISLCRPEKIHRLPSNHGQETLNQ